MRCRDLPGLDLDGLGAWLARAGVFAAHRDLLGNRPAVDLDECWVRRQVPTAATRPGSGPHSWHQDGALRHDFSRAADAPGQGLLTMLTCWIALTPCGLDAPGLELIRTDRLDLLTPPELRSDAIAHRFPASAHWRPMMGIGDALVFTGDVLHRTHVDAGMTHGRCSLELRFFDATRWPDRLAGDRRAEVQASEGAAPSLATQAGRARSARYARAGSPEVS
ncbi:MAG: phytanoyl-CoA dioxygenase family protein [Burkholderiaceae bacterium]